MIGSVEVFKENAFRLIQKEEKLKKAIKEAISANHSKSVFLANMSHELRTPLNAILGFTTLLKKASNLESQQKQNLQTIHSSGKYLLQIINEILELSKIEAGKIDIVCNDFDLYNLLDDIKAMFEVRYKNKNINFNVNIQDDLPRYVRSDEQRLRQIIINLLGNALKFTDSGSVDFNISSKEKRLYFEVIDTGKGIESKNLKNIFKPFEQVKDDNYIQKGTGLGLSITKELVELLGGKIKVISIPNEGSKFYFDIKFELSLKDKIEENFEKSKNIKEIIELKKHTVLVVDDIEVNRELIVQMLNQHGIKTLEAHDGLEALDIIEKEEIDLIFMDISMPKLNGLELTKKLKSDENYKDIPVVIVSANVLKTDEQKALQSGADGFLAKPIDEVKFYKLIKKYLEVKFTYDKKREKKTFHLADDITEKLNKAILELDSNKIEEILNQSELDEKSKKELIDISNRFEFEKLKEILYS